MDIQSECKVLEGKLKGFCKPMIYINPDTYDQADTKFYYALMQKILRSLPLDVQEVMIQEGTFTPLQHFKELEFYNIFANILKKNQNQLKAANVTILPYDQWARKTFSAMKIRMISAFVDILRSRQARKQQKAAADIVDKQFIEDFKEFQGQTKNSEGGYCADYKEIDEIRNHSSKSFSVPHNTRQNEYGFSERGYEAAKTKAMDQTNKLNIDLDFLAQQTTILTVLTRLESKVDDIGNRLTHVEGIVRGLYVEYHGGQ